MTEIKTETIAYQAGADALTGYLAYDAALTAKRPAVLIVHEFWGLTDNVRRRADMLAKLGFTAFALDMYGTGKVTDQPEQAQSYMQDVMSDMKRAEARFVSARDLVAAHASVDAGKIAAIGYCFGGAVVLHMARAGIDLKGVVSFHGILETQSPAEKGKVKARILVLNGADDPFAPPEQVKKFEAEMTAAGVAFEVVNYPGVVHGFTNPGADDIGKRYGLPVKYDKAADEDSWTRMLTFFEEIF